MLTPFFYDCALYLVAILSFPKMAYQMAFYKKYRNSFAKRLGKGFPLIEKGNRRLIWIHAVSVGETKAVMRMAEKLKKSGDNPILVISSITETGHAEALRSIPAADYHVYLPFDFPWIIRPIIAKCRPDLVILCETDFWYNFLCFSRQFGAKIALVNGKMSARSAARFKRFPRFSRSLFSLIDLYCLQSSHYRSGFEDLGIPEEKIAVTGNLKFDERPEKLSDTEKAALKGELGLSRDDKVLVIGSTHDPEEKQLLNELQKLWRSIPSLKVILVPRHPERFNEVASLLKSNDVPFSRYSQKGILEKEPVKVILVDAMGMLRKCYQIADAAIVAGSYTAKVGGHNILEPLWYGVPLIYGPYMHSQPALAELVQQYNAGKQVAVEKLQDELKGILCEANNVALKERGQKLIADVGGSTERTYNLMEEKFSSGVCVDKKCEIY